MKYRVTFEDEIEAKGWEGIAERAEECFQRFGFLITIEELSTGDKRQYEIDLNEIESEAPVKAMGRIVLPPTSVPCVNYWPSSQICTDCESGHFLVNEEPSTYACMKGVNLGSCAASCDKYEQKEECDGS